ncbi:hypothetical protein CHCC20441_0686 [Bacillus licheniformis]|nr:hypothetical protein B4090_2528 [Bacillus licheniformis]TWN16377.1 hypothetical protein CHCC14564_0942 [Bacillus licheniformis LMG 17339]KYC85526.1 hypothetical protein B4091_2533 [Bacillus licheniformis]KYD01658.1 hypothetical protein B4164_2342 [Bacillus licheniformis]OLF86906.1 hypothetical protein B4094_4324 [Bacillus licheniformis]
MSDYEWAIRKRTSFSQTDGIRLFKHCPLAFQIRADNAFFYEGQLMNGGV